ncbi:sulfatase-like hydrolase/transferase [Actinoplanes sp. NBRC 101535]|uniref:sulfatase-like hydrolase/transferase n=1 Tax=Actinoplanes sp. NBRC 101535 TaxID=3032196 RepID=UPI0024A0547D|nr:sulfatase-like hydrolase/transferase [Actinoplanes sp. NBRC 101535]GLY05623.1 hypothetical protein Acsp01_60020 [Actinoplanes sp. NBRC 101535]
MSPTKPYRRVLRHVTTGFALLLVFLALIVPDQITRLPPGNSVWTALVRIPVEALVAGMLLLSLPQKGRFRRVFTITIGVILGLLTVVKLVDVGFFAVLARRFDPVLDWALFDDGFNFLVDSLGRPSAIGVAVGVAVLAVGLVAGMTWAIQRLGGILTAHRARAWRGLGTVGVAWVALAALGVQLIGGIPVASYTASELAAHTALALPNDLRDRERFAAEVKIDAYRDQPGDQLLTALRDKDVMLAFIESYGRDAVENPEFNGAVLNSLAANTERLAKAGFSARSGWLTSPTSGGGSWLAHSTFLSGMWVENEARYRSLVASDRLTLTRAFKNSGHRSVGVEPGISFAWPEGQFYGYDHIYDSHTLGYNGPAFSWSSMPDQFVMKAYHDLEHSKTDRPKLAAEITLTSSHTPWAPVPGMLDWDAMGDGSVYGPVVADAETPQSLYKDNHRVRTEYARSIAYSVDSLMQYLEKYGDENTVMVFLGDHQPNSIVVGLNASHDVPITVVAKDPKVLDRIASWGWTDGIKPDTAAPVWRMDTFRDRFLAAYGPENDPH